MKIGFDLLDVAINSLPLKHNPLHGFAQKIVFNKNILPVFHSLLFLIYDE